MSDSMTAHLKLLRSYCQYIYYQYPAECVNVHISLSNIFWFPVYFPPAIIAFSTLLHHIPVQSFSLSTNFCLFYSVCVFFSCCLLLWPLPLLFSTFFYVCCYFNQPACHHTVTIWDVREEQNKKLKREREEERGKKDLRNGWRVRNFCTLFWFCWNWCSKGFLPPFKTIFLQNDIQIYCMWGKRAGGWVWARGKRTTLDEKDRSCKGNKRNNTDQE